MLLLLSAKDLSLPLKRKTLVFKLPVLKAFEPSDLKVKVKELVTSVYASFKS
jgi:hypothetical protein